MVMQEKKPPPLKKAKIEAEFKRQVRTCKNWFIPYHHILPSRSIQHQVNESKEHDIDSIQSGFFRRALFVQLPELLARPRRASQRA